MPMKRRLFLLSAGLAAAGVSAAASPLLPLLARKPGKGSTKGQPVLVLLELKGGNDGLNTVIPYRDPAYRSARPTLAIDDGPLLGDDLILHPALSPLMGAWGAKRLAFALGVGWAKPNRSHFRAQDQWATGTLAGEGDGWFATAVARGQEQRSLVVLGPSGSAALEGAGALNVQMDPQAQQEAGRGRRNDPLEPSRAGSNLILRRMLELEAAGNQEVQRLSQSLAALPNGLTLPRGSLGQQVGLALRLIGSPDPPAVIQIEPGGFAGFDTHAQQLVRHGRSLSQLGDALAAFDQGLRLMTNRPQVSLLAVSEFGRRLQQNASGGTDHGSASVALLLGDGVPHPFLGSYPSLTDLDERGDLVPSFSPVQLYDKMMVYS